MKVIVTSEFYDLKEDKLRKVGETFEVSNARFDEIIKKGGEWIEEVTDDEDDEEKTKVTGEEKGTEEEAAEEKGTEEEAATVEEMETVEKVDNKTKKNTTPKKAGAKNDGGRTKKA